jgi:hypothetical protein
VKNRRLKLGIVAIVEVNVFFIVGVIIKDVDAVYPWAVMIAVVCLLVGGYLTATDIVKLRNGGGDAS